MVHHRSRLSILSSLALCHILGRLLGEEKNTFSIVGLHCLFSLQSDYGGTLSHGAHHRAGVNDAWGFASTEPVRADLLDDVTAIARTGKPHCTLLLPPTRLLLMPAHVPQRRARLTACKKATLLSLWRARMPRWFAHTPPY